MGCYRRFMRKKIDEVYSLLIDVKYANPELEQEHVQHHKLASLMICDAHMRFGTCGLGNLHMATMPKTTKS